MTTTRNHCSQCSRVCKKTATLCTKCERRLEEALYNVENLLKADLDAGARTRLVNQRVEKFVSATDGSVFLGKIVTHDGKYWYAYDTRGATACDANGETVHGGYPSEDEAIAAVIANARRIQGLLKGAS